MSAIGVPGSIERLPDGVNTFRAPVHQLLSDKAIRKIGERLYEAVSADPIQIKDGDGRVEQVLTAGTVFVSITWDLNKAWHNCYIDWTRR